MPNRKVTCALVIGLAGAFALSLSTSSFAAPKYPKDSYETWGAKQGMAPPVPGFALSGYKPGLCWKVNNNDRQSGEYVPCSQWRKHR